MSNHTIILRSERRANTGGDDIRNEEVRRYELTEEEAHIEYKYGRQVDNCRTFQILVDNKIITPKCQKLLCPQCGGWNRSIHREKNRAVLKHIGSPKKKPSGNSFLQCQKNLGEGIL